MVMTELKEGSSVITQQGELTLRNRVRIDFPRVVTQTPLWKQIPTRGNIGYIDIQEPKIIHILNKQGQEVIKKRMPVTANVQTKPRENRRKYSALVVRTPARTPEKSYDTEIRDAAERLKGGLIENRPGAAQKLGVMIVVEDLGNDRRIRWREDKFSLAGLVRHKETDDKNSQKAEKPGEGFLIPTGEYLITVARIHKEHPYLDATSYVKADIEHTTDELKNSGMQEIDASGIISEMRSTKMLPATIAKARDMGGITVRTAEGTTVTRDSRGETISQVGETPLENQLGILPKKKRLRPGESGHRDCEIEKTEIPCWDCSPEKKVNLIIIYRATPGESRWQIRGTQYCPEPTHSGDRVSKEWYDGYGSLLPKRVVIYETKRNNAGR